MEKDKIYKWKCPECGKEIKSIWKNQFEYNKEQHIEFHKRKKVKKREVKMFKIKEVLMAFALLGVLFLNGCGLNIPEGAKCLKNHLN